MNDFGMKFFEHIFYCESDFHATKIRFFMYLIFFLCICPIYAMCKIKLWGLILNAEDHNLQEQRSLEEFADMFEKQSPSSW